MRNAHQDVPDMPGMPSRDVCALRCRTLAEELLELCDALDVDIRMERNRANGVRFYGVDANPSPYASVQLEPETNLRDAYDAVLDILVFAVGTAIALGLELEPGWEEVHRSNMTKFIDGFLREDGKWMKGPSYDPPRLAPIIQAQIAEAERRRKESS